MAKKLVQNITAREEDFAQWYTDVVREAKLCDYSGVKGCMNYLPNGYALWENIQKNLDARFKETGVENVYLPVMIPESLLQKEKDHIEGFAPEVAWVTHGGLEELQERFCIRPTSETLFCDVWSKTVQSYRDLPKVWNQWCSVLRWEKTTRPFLRSREFLWQEGHTVHATEEEAEALDKALSAMGQKMDYAINVEVPDENIVNRMSGRRACVDCGATYHIVYAPTEKEDVCDKCGGSLILRDDDKPETVLKRLGVYHEQTQPLIDYYTKAGILKEVDGTIDMNDVFAAIVQILGE